MRRKIRKRVHASLRRLEDFPDDLHRENAKIPRPEKTVKGDYMEPVPIPLPLFTQVPRETVWKVAQGPLESGFRYYNSARTGLLCPVSAVRMAIGRVVREFPDSLSRARL